VLSALTSKGTVSDNVIVCMSSCLARNEKQY